ncbi:MAG: aminotransferase class I/II-fold pyridoxal phosphate-dependent enzyme [Oscillospiraceae bacterium]
MYSFLNDYSEGAHERIMEALAATNREQTCGYGMDDYCEKARDLIAARLGGDVAGIHFLVGGTQANMTVISAALKAHQGVISAKTGHINAHETGAVEATGHKVLTIETENGKLSAEDVDKLINAHYMDENFEHTVQPGMVYISNPTEIGTIYSKKELTELSCVCAKHKVPLFLDGARLGCALTCDENDLTLADIAHLTDVFYIGGTKMGALFGEAVVIANEEINRDFRYHIKQRGGMLAKGRLLGIQFAALFEDDLYFELARHANVMARKLSDGIRKLGFDFLVDSPTNQLFPIFEKQLIASLSESFVMSVWQTYDDTRDAVRLCTSWATKEAHVDEFLSKLGSASH